MAGGQDEKDDSEFHDAHLSVCLAGGTLTSDYINRPHKGGFIFNKRIPESSFMPIAGGFSPGVKRVQVEGNIVTLKKKDLLPGGADADKTVPKKRNTQ
jgi:hypothetical protein